MIKAVIFDLDDTLISEYEYIKSGFCHVSKVISEKHGFEQAEVYDKLLNCFNKDSKNVFNAVLDLLNISYTSDEILLLVNEYRNHIPKIKYYGDVITCVTLLKQKGIKLGIISDGYKETQKNKLNAVNAYDLFDKVILTDELGREFWKPHTKSFKMIREYFNVEFNEMLYVGDNPEKDFHVKKYIPIKTFRIKRDKSVYADREYKDGIMEDLLIDSLLQIEDHL